MQQDLPFRVPAVRTWADYVHVDNFAGGGGASTGLEMALGRSPDIAINHDPQAIAMHEANHPTTRHYVESVWEVDPVEATGGKPVGVAWFSPDCKHFSKSKGGKPREQKIRGLAWVAVRWAKAVQPRIIALENVEEFQDWGPLHKTHSNGCRGDGRGQNPGSICRTGCHYMRPIKARKGETFRAFVRKLESYGYTVAWELFRAHNYGAPTKRRRLFLVARCDGKPIAWPAPSNGPGQEAAHLTSAGCIDWSIPCPSIFSRKLADKTLARVARGAHKFVLTAARPFIVTMRGTSDSHVASSATSMDEPLRTVSADGTHHGIVTPYLVPTNHGGKDRNDLRVYDAAEPMPTVTGAHRGEVALIAPYLVHRSNGERVGQAPRIYDPREPFGTIMAQGQKHAVVCAFLAKHYGGHESTTGGKPLDVPFDTVTSVDHHSLVAAHLVRYNGTGDAEPVDVPLGTLTTKDRYGLVESQLEAGDLTAEQLAGARRVAAFLRKYGYDVGELATVTIDGAEYVIVDLGMRMLVPRELFRAQGFPDTYKIDPIFNGKPLTKTAQVRMCGNSVCPPMAAAIVRAQLEAA